MYRKEVREDEPKKRKGSDIASIYFPSDWGGGDAVRFVGCAFDLHGGIVNLIIPESMC